MLSFSYSLFFWVGHYWFPTISGQIFSGVDYFVALCTNLAFVGIVYLLFRRITNNTQKLATIWLSILLIISAVLSLRYQWFLWFAIVGIFLRPNYIFVKEYPFSDMLDRCVEKAFDISVIILWSLMHIQIEVWQGIILGIAAYSAQFLVAQMICHIAKWYSIKDKLFLWTAQYNGITSIILANIIVPYRWTGIGIVAIALLTITILYVICNKFLEYKFRY